jgi:hypothetical protein
MKVAACALVFVAVAAIASGKTLTNKKLGVSVEVPDNWVDSPTAAQMAPPPAELIAGLVNPEKTGTFIALGAPMDPHEVGVRDNFLRGLENSLTKQGLTLSSSSHVTIDGVDFESRTAAATGDTVPRMQILFTFTSTHLLSLMSVSTVGDATQDPELKAMVQSIRFLTPPRPLATSNTAYNVGYKVGRILAIIACPAIALLVIGGALGGGYLLFRKKK